MLNEMGTDFYHPGSRDMSDTYERQVRASEKVVLDTLGKIQEDLSQVKTDTREIHQTLFGPRGQEYLGVLPQTEGRLQSLEKRFWTTAIGVIVTLLAGVWQLLRRG